MWREAPESELNGATLADGSYVIISDRDQLELATDDVVARRLSGLGETIVGFVEEHTTCSSAECWRGGRQLWWIYHDSNRRGGVMHLETDGRLPACYADVFENLKRQQETQPKGKFGCDYIFDVPVEVACREGGYRHDRNLPGLEGDAYEELKRMSESGSGTLAHWWTWCRGILRRWAKKEAN